MYKCRRNFFCLEQTQLVYLISPCLWSQIQLGNPTVREEKQC